VVGWTGLLVNNNAKITRVLQDFQPGFKPEVETAPFVIAILATVLWLVIVWRVGRSMRRSVVNWASGITLIWILAMTLWLPWLDSGKSYRSMVASLNMPCRSNTSVSSDASGRQSARDAALFGDIITETDPKNRCDLHLIRAAIIQAVAQRDALEEDLGRQPQDDRANTSGCIGESKNDDPDNLD